MEMDELKARLEAILFASGEPVPAGRISLVLGISEEDVFCCAEELAGEYIAGMRGLRLLRLENALQLCSAPEYAREISRVIEHRAPPKLSQPARSSRIFSRLPGRMLSRSGVLTARTP